MKQNESIKKSYKGKLSSWFNDNHERIWALDNDPFDLYDLLHNMEGHEVKITVETIDEEE